MPSVDIRPGAWIKDIADPFAPDDLRVVTMPAGPPLFKLPSNVQDLPEYKAKMKKQYVPFHFETRKPKLNGFHDDKKNYPNPPAIFSTRGGIYPKRRLPTHANIDTKNATKPLGDHPVAVEVIAARFRKEFPLECKAVTDLSWTRLSYYFDDLDISQWGVEFLERVLLYIFQQNSNLGSRLLRFGVHLVATDSERAKQICYFGRAVWFYEEVAHYGGEFLEEMVKFMTHRSDVYSKLQTLAGEYMEEARENATKNAKWYDQTFSDLLRAQARRAIDQSQASCVLKHQIAAPRAPAYLDPDFIEREEEPKIVPQLAIEKATDRSENIISNSHRRRTSSFGAILKDEHALIPEANIGKTMECPTTGSKSFAGNTNAVVSSDRASVKTVAKGNSLAQRSATDVLPFRKRTQPIAIDAASAERNIENVASNKKANKSRSASKGKKKTSGAIDNQTAGNVGAINSDKIENFVAKDSVEKSIHKGNMESQPISTVPSKAPTSKKSQNKQPLASQDVRNIVRENKKHRQQKSGNKKRTASGSESMQEAKRGSFTGSEATDPYTEDKDAANGNLSEPANLTNWETRKKQDLRVDTNLTDVPSGFRRVPTSEMNLRFNGDKSLVSNAKNDKKHNSPRQSPSLSVATNLPHRGTHKKGRNFSSHNRRYHNQMNRQQSGEQKQQEVYISKVFNNGFAIAHEKAPLRFNQIQENQIPNVPLPPMIHHQFPMMAANGQMMLGGQQHMPLLPPFGHMVDTSQGMGPTFDQGHQNYQNYDQNRPANSHRSFSQASRGSNYSRRGGYEKRYRVPEEIQFGDFKPVLRNPSRSLLYRAPTQRYSSSNYEDPAPQEPNHPDTIHHPLPVMNPYMFHPQFMAPPPHIPYYDQTGLYHPNQYQVHDNRSVSQYEVPMMPELPPASEPEVAPISTTQPLLAPPVQESYETEASDVSTTGFKYAIVYPSPNVDVKPLNGTAGSNALTAQNLSAKQQAIDDSDGFYSAMTRLNHGSEPTTEEFTDIPDKAVCHQDATSASNNLVVQDVSSIGHMVVQPELKTVHQETALEKDDKLVTSPSSQANSTKINDSKMDKEIGNPISKVVEPSVNEIEVASTKASNQADTVKKCDSSYEQRKCTGIQINTAEFPQLGKPVGQQRSNKHKKTASHASKQTGSNPSNQEHQKSPKETLTWAQKAGRDVPATIKSNNKTIDVSSKGDVQKNTFANRDTTIPTAPKSQLDQGDKRQFNVHSQHANSVQNYGPDTIDPFKLYISGANLTREILIKILEPFNAVHAGPPRPCRQTLYPRLPHQYDGMMYTFVTFGSVEACNEARKALAGHIKEGIYIKANAAYDKVDRDRVLDQRYNILAMHDNNSSGSKEKVGESTNVNRKSSVISSPADTNPAKNGVKHQDREKKAFVITQTDGADSPPSQKSPYSERTFKSSSRGELKSFHQSFDSTSSSESSKIRDIDKESMIIPKETHDLGEVFYTKVDAESQDQSSLSESDYPQAIAPPKGSSNKSKKKQKNKKKGSLSRKSSGEASDTTVKEESTPYSLKQESLSHATTAIAYPDSQPQHNTGRAAQIVNQLEALRTLMESLPASSTSSAANPVNGDEAANESADNVTADSSQAKSDGAANVQQDQSMLSSKDPSIVTIRDKNGYDVSYPKLVMQGKQIQKQMRDIREHRFKFLTHPDQTNGQTLSEEHTNPSDDSDQFPPLARQTLTAPDSRVAHKQKNVIEGISSSADPIDPLSNQMGDMNLGRNIPIRFGRSGFTQKARRGGQRGGKGSRVSRSSSNDGTALKYNQDRDKNEDEKLGSMTLAEKGKTNQPE